jgi:hypothetical protein
MVQRGATVTGPTRSFTRKRQTEWPYSLRSQKFPSDRFYCGEKRSFEEP